MELELEQHIQEFDTNEDKKRMINERISIAKREQEFFVSLFPEEKILDIKISDYVLGKSDGKDKTFSYLIEYGSTNFGKIGSGSSRHFVVYYSQDNQKFVYHESFKSHTEAYDKTINLIAKCVHDAHSAVESKSWEMLDFHITQLIEWRDETPPIGVISKIIAMYFPDDFIRIWSHKWLNNALDAFQIKRADLHEGQKEGNFYRKMGQLMKFKNLHPIMQKWSNTYFSYVIGAYLKSKIEIEQKSRLLNFLKSKMRMKANYQPIVIKMLLESPNHTITIHDIRKKFDELNFGRSNFVSSTGKAMGNDAIDSVKKALKKYARFPEGTSDGNVTLIEKNYDESYRDECLKICGQKIAEWHINEIMKSEYDMLHIMPGNRESNFKYLDEFLKTDSIGVGWSNVGDISNLSDSEIQQKFEEKYEKGWTPFENFTRIKSKDVIVLIKGQQEIVDFGIVVGNYEFRDADEFSYAHRKKIVWLNRGTILANELPNPTMSGFLSTCKKIGTRKQEMEEVLLDENVGKLSLSNNSELSSMSDNEESELDDQLNPSELTYWPFTQVAKMKQEFIQLGVQLATNFDGKEVSDDTKKDFMIMLENSGIYSSTGDNVSSMEMVTVVKKFGTYQTLLTFYGLGSFQNGKFKISELCKYWLKEKEDLISFARHMALRLQFPNATQIQSHQDEFHAQQIRISPFTLLLQILLKLNNNSQDMAYLSEDEIKAIVFQIRTMDEIDDKVNLILRHRKDNRSYEDALENFPTKGEESIKRLFPVFDSTELMQLDLSNKSKILKLNKSKIPIINQILDSFEFDFFEWNGNKEAWDNHFGANQ